MQAYQFIKYNGKTTIQHLLKKSKTKAVLCFDFEDSIQSVNDSNKTNTLKSTYREYFKNLVYGNKERLTNIKIGVRLNSNNQKELEKDIQVLKGLHLYSIFLPKIESKLEIENTVRQLDQANISYKEIVPIIESYFGRINLAKIIEDCNSKIKNIAFGHCDYNLSLEIFPFFHQENVEYWKWVEDIIFNIKHKGLGFINSPYLRLKEDDFFCAMIHYLEKITNNNFGQITLSDTQSQLCVNRAVSEGSFRKLIDNRYNLLYREQEAIEFCNQFEEINKDKGFVKIWDRIISYHEYIIAKKIIKTKMRVSNVTFLGGCFSMQYDLPFELHFHQLLKKKIANEKGVELNYNLVRYERFNTTLEKIKKIKIIDTLIFSIRPEPFLRLLKFYYKHYNNQGKLKHSVNLSFIRLCPSEKYDLLMLGRKYADYKTSNESSFHKFMLNGNYILGKVFGNQKYAIKKYQELIAEIYRYCEENNIKLILLGPNLRSRTKFEPLFCKELDKAVKNSLKKNITYISGLEGEMSSKFLFNKNGIHVNKKYHELIANKLCNVMDYL